MVSITSKLTISAILIVVIPNLIFIIDKRNVMIVALAIAALIIALKLLIKPFKYTKH